MMPTTPKDKMPDWELAWHRFDPKTAADSDAETPHAHSELYRQYFKAGYLCAKAETPSLGQGVEQAPAIVRWARNECTCDSVNFKCKVHAADVTQT